MTGKEYLEETFLFYKPEISIHKDGDYEIICEVDMFNDHLMYFIRKHNPTIIKGFDRTYDYCHSSDYEDVIAEFLEEVNNKQL